MLEAFSFLLYPMNVASFNGSFMENFIAVNIINFTNMVMREEEVSCEESFIAIKSI